MTATALLSDLQALGITLQPQGDRLRFHPRAAVTPELLARIREHKAELLRLLAQPQPIEDPQPQDADDWRDFTTDDRQGIERPDAPARIQWDAQPQRQPRAVEHSSDWPADLADFVLLLAPDDLPKVFSPRPAATVTNAAKYLAGLQADIRRGAAGPRARYGALQDDLRRLRDIVNSEADRRQQMKPAPDAKHRHDLQAERRNAAERFQQVAQAILAEAGVAVVEYHDHGLRGTAWAKEKRVRIPRPTTRRRLYIVAHEAGHIAHNHAGGVSHRQEYEAELYAHAALRRHGIAVPRKETQRARQYVARKIHQAIRRGAKRIDPEALEWCQDCWTPTTAAWVQDSDDQQPKRPARMKRPKPSEMSIERRGREWWITNCEPFTVDGETFDAMGPYATRAEAADDLRGLLRTSRHGNAIKR